MSTRERALAPTEASRLVELEKTVEKGIHTFVEVGHALAEIRNGRLYRQTHSTFENYCRERWQLSRPRAYQLMASAKVATALSTTVDTPERVLRPLAKLDPEKRAEVWSKATKAAGSEPVTSKHINAAVIDSIPEEKGAEVRPRLGLAPAPEADPRERVLSAVTTALWIYQNDDTAGRRGKPGPADRKEIRREVDRILREFTKGTLQLRGRGRAPKSETAVPQDAPGSTQRYEDDPQHGGDEASAP